MSELTLGVLSPYLGGWYFGGLLHGIAEAAADARAGVVAVQTLEAGTGNIEVTEAPELRYPIAWQHVAGFVVIINAVQPRYLAALRAAGKPIVIISHEVPSVDCPVVLPDNRSGVREAVAHLVGHGHRRIAFAGYLGAKDIRQRYEAYRAALLAHDITPDPSLFFAAGDNQESGGEHAARAMITAAHNLAATGLPSTAVITGTDANAVGLMGVLTNAGYRIPEDQAVVGFDDLRAASYTLPRLTTVHQPIHEIGQTAATTLLATLRGEPVPPGRTQLPTTLVIRESCGCPPPDEPVPPDRQAGEAREHFRERTFLQVTLSKQFEASMDLLRSHEEDPRDLRWLARTSARAGCLALWRERGLPSAPQRDPLLDVVGVFPASGTATAPLPTSRFPPPDLIGPTDGESMVFVVPVKVDDSDWGLLAIVDTVETRVGTAREPSNHWAALLTVALDYQAVLATLRQQEEQLRVAATYDHLTGLPNRTLFLDRLRHALRRRTREFAVLFVDLDGFKVVNDSLGHTAGDGLLVQVANRIVASLRADDTAARFGGDEFLILLDGVAEPYTPARVAERLHAALARPFRLHGQDVVVTASIGITLADERYTDADDLVRDADIAMYWSKSHRKGSHAVFDVAMHARAVTRLQVETELRQAVERGELELHYQPIVHLGTGRSRGYEALIRWRHPTRGLLLPEEFLAVAEESGLIIPIGRWAIATACRQLAEWRRTPDRDDLRISLNVSNRQFWQGGLVDEVESALRRSDLPASSLAFEITEGVIMDNVALACKMLEDVHALGCELHIDDFGTGYSSLEALHRLPIDALKIDKSFVAGLGIDTKSSALVQTIVLMGSSLGLQLIAESVETDLQRATLLRLGCAYGQGHLFSEPLPPHLL
ncbi:EAL domain-containing protein [Actinomycetes bacterium KLBMP 9797]